MKFIITIFALLVFSLSSAKTTEQFKSDSLSNRILELEKKTNTIEKEFAHSLIQEYKDLNSIYSVGFTVLIGLFGIVFPTFLYFVQIKPAQDALKEAKLLVSKLDEKFEHSFEKHMAESKNKLINQAIESFESQIEQSLPTAYTLLDTYKIEKFTTSQINKLLKFLQSDEYHNENKTFFATILSMQSSNDIENYFANLLKNIPADDKCIWGAIYFAKNKKTEYFDLIASVVLNGYSLVGMISSLSYYSKEFALQLLDNEKLIANFSEYDTKAFCEFIERGNHPIISKSQFERTKFYIRYKSHN